MRCIAVLLALGLAGATQAQTIVWTNDPGGVAVAVDAGDNVYTARWDFNPAGDIFVAKRNAAGALLWEVRHDNTDSNRHEVATWVETDAQGNVFVSGTLRSGISNPVVVNSLLMKFAPDGRLLWRQVWGEAFDGSYTRKVLVDTLGNAYVLGLGMSAAGQRTTVRKFGPDGATVWAWSDPIGIGAPLNLKWGADGALLVSARGLTGTFNGYARLDRNGQAVWTLPGVPSLTAGDAAGDAAGNSYLIDSDYAARSGSLLRKLAPDGNLVWQRAHAMTGLRVEVGSDGAPVVGGYASGGFGAAFTKHSADGQLLWTNLDADGPGVALLALAQMKLDAEGSAYLAAGSMSQMGVAKVYANGAAAWTVLVPFGYAQALAFGSAQRVFLTGGTTARIDQAGGTTLPPPLNPPLPPPPPPPAVVTADLGLTLIDRPDPVRVGARLSVTATVSNAGPGTATLVALNATLPAGLTLLGIVPSQGGCSGSTALRCAFGSLAPGASATVTLNLRAQSRGNWTSSASVGGAQPDPNSVNNAASVGTTVRR
ncbi:exported hypothetical protein [Rubrivivax sp. A210]|uniref:DUF11 domain-containing protein n=1 Tax=Rubrivivax sp. A210 TaxID=2772301 RepID=UPI00191A88CA|nr:DUF11 domain-containing protein [Rubrivivax sp. A210]CAD5373296.1 exported hypothetical protein [Rubrivivax sp. A210]